MPMRVCSLSGKFSATFAVVLVSCLGRVALGRLLLRRSSAAVANVCKYQIPATRPAGADADAIRFIERAYDEQVAAVAHLGDNDVIHSAEGAGPRGPKKCRRADGDGNCEVATCGEDTYGEITQPGAAELFAHPQVRLLEGDSFVDLGSGLGKLVVDAAILAGASQAVGIELSHFRWSAGCDAFANIAGNMNVSTEAGSHSAPVRHVELRLGDMLDADVAQADVVYVASLCFRPALMEQLRAALVRKLKLGARVVSLRRFPDPLPALASSERAELEFQSKLRIPMTWSSPEDPQPVFVYRANAKS